MSLIKLNKLDSLAMTPIVTFRLFVIASETRMINVGEITLTVRTDADDITSLFVALLSQYRFRDHEFCVCARRFERTSTFPLSPTHPPTSFFQTIPLVSILLTICGSSWTLLGLLWTLHGPYLDPFQTFVEAG